ncbi:unnamed protein product [Clavelina lepadiformis]|uniref:Core-binding (CB) domain-containing protein n=1 Tax=Clavelina lepadiformis TaxID=159417 RepID=A0ABP0H2R5_CLALP
MPYMKDMEVSNKQNITPDTRTVEAFLEQLNNEDYLSKNRQQCLNSLKSFKRYALQVGLSPQQLLVTCKLSASRKIAESPICMKTCPGICKVRRIWIRPSSDHQETCIDLFSVTTSLKFQTLHVI